MCKEVERCFKCNEKCSVLFWKCNSGMYMMLWRLSLGVTTVFECLEGVLIKKKKQNPKLKSGTSYDFAIGLECSHKVIELRGQ